MLTIYPRRCASRIALVLAMSAATPALAQEQAAPAANEAASDDGEIIVTAQKRSESCAEGADLHRRLQWRDA